MDTDDIGNENTISEAFNEMPIEYRKIAINLELIVRIRDLQRLKTRIKENYERELKYINEQIKIYKRSIKL
jgi:hypothetical protein